MLTILFFVVAGCVLRDTCGAKDENWALRRREGSAADIHRDLFQNYDLPTLLGNKSLHHSMFSDVTKRSTVQFFPQRTVRMATAVPVIPTPSRSAFQCS
jgi:hypothetical protein